MMLKLQVWWSSHYNRPLKDPILQDYTFEELYLEYRCIMDREQLRKEEMDEITKKNDPAEIEDQALDEALAWAEAEEAKDLELMQQKQAELEEQARIEAEKKKWMDEQLEEQKRLYGEDFGEDFSIGEEE